MNLHRHINLTVLAALLVGLVAGQAFSERNLQAAQAATIEHGRGPIQAARAAVDFLKYDMERAGYAEVLSAGQTKVRVSHQDKLRLVKAEPDSVTFRTPEGRETIFYRYDAGKITRTVVGPSSEHLLLLERAVGFKISQVNDGAAINLSFSVPTGDAANHVIGLAPFYAHFVRAAE